jgi:hypothetical protein
MLRVVGDTPLYIDVDPVGQTVSWSKLELNGVLAGSVTTVDADQAALFVNELRCAVNDIAAGEDHPQARVDGDVPLYVEADAQIGSIEFSTIQINGALAGDIVFVDAIQAGNFVTLLLRGIAVARTRLGDLNPHP